MAKFIEVTQEIHSNSRDASGEWPKPTFKQVYINADLIVSFEALFDRGSKIYFLNDESINGLSVTQKPDELLSLISSAK